MFIATWVILCIPYILVCGRKARRNEDRVFMPNAVLDLDPHETNNNRYMAQWSHDNAFSINKVFKRPLNPVNITKAIYKLVSKETLKH